jgi:hypothetical protein
VAGLLSNELRGPGAGKSKGYRTVVIYRKNEKAFFIFGFPKNSLGNLRNDEEEQFKKAARIILGLSDTQIESLIEKGQLEELTDDE